MSKRLFRLEAGAPDNLDHSPRSRRGAALCGGGGQVVSQTTQTVGCDIPVGAYTYNYYLLSFPGKRRGGGAFHRRPNA